MITPGELIVAGLIEWTICLFFIGAAGTARSLGHVVIGTRLKSFAQTLAIIALIIFSIGVGGIWGLRQ